MNTTFNLTKDFTDAIEFFWVKRLKQKSNSQEKSGRGAVTGGKQLDGFITLLRNACKSIGVPESCIYTKDNYVAGYFRPSKNWDFMILTPHGKLLVLIELKSQIGSYGNNFNNRAEEAIGNATDLWTSYRDDIFPSCGTPWIGYIMIIGKDAASTQPVKNYEHHFPVLSEFIDSSYIDRYRILCNKLVKERLYTSSCLIWTCEDGSFGDVAIDLSLAKFINSLQGYLIGNKDEFNC